MVLLITFIRYKINQFKCENSNILAYNDIIVIEIVEIKRTKLKMYRTNTKIPITISPILVTLKNQIWLINLFPLNLK